MPCYADIRTLDAKRLQADGIAVDAICGGFPCQDISVVGKGKGLDGEQSGLWREFARLVGELRPGLVIVENVAALLIRGLDRVLGDLAALGYDAEWHCIPASALGAPHYRDRIWIIAWPSSGDRATPHVADADSISDRQRVSADQARRLEPILAPSRLRRGAGDGQGWWAAEPGVGRVADGFPGRAQRIRALGNAVVPPIPYLIGHAVLKRVQE